MNLYACVAPAFATGSPLDHTWVTDYDPRSIRFPDLTAVVAAGRHFWFCRGDYRPAPKTVLLAAVSGHKASTCLVKPNATHKESVGASGTVRWYGIDGVCHQVANQVLYTTGMARGANPVSVEGARGYGVSSAVFNTYGRRKREWDEARLRCNVAPPSIQIRRSETSLLSRRLAYALDVSIRGSRVVELENARRLALRTLDQIGFRPQADGESPVTRAAELNGAIRAFLRYARDLMEKEDLFRRVFWTTSTDDIQIVDPELFEFPTESAPERSAVEGW